MDPLLVDTDRLWATFAPNPQLRPFWARLLGPADRLPARPTWHRPAYVPDPEPTPVTPPAKRPLAPTQEGLALRLCRPTRHDLDRRGTGLHRLTAFVEQYPEAFRLADVCTDQTGFIDWDELDASVRAATGHKSTATIVRRLTSLTHYAWYHTARRRAPFPPTERLLWDYTSETPTSSDSTPKPPASSRPSSGRGPSSASTYRPRHSPVPASWAWSRPPRHRRHRRSEHCAPSPPNHLTGDNLPHIPGPP